jgi:UDP:flavonoid glycosyltransferase YjiC (YdhE family)
MRVLMITTPVPTHFTSLVPLAWAMRAAGHELVVAGQPDTVPTVRSAGLIAAEMGERFDILAYLRAKLPTGRRPLEAWPRPAPPQMGFFGRVWMDHAKKMLQAHLAMARDWRPDLIIAEQLEYTSLIVGGVLGVPVVHHRWGVDAISDLALRDAETELAGLARQSGLTALPRPALKLDPCPPTLQVPTAVSGTPIRYVPFNGTAVVPDWIRPGRARRVAVTLGNLTLALNGVPYVRRLLTALAGLPDIELIITVDPAYQEALQPLPAQVRVVDPTPLHLFMDTCDAVVHHGGAGTTLTATAAGVPQMVLPQIADAFAAGERLQCLGAGRHLDQLADQDDPGTLRDALEALLSEPGYRKAAQKLGREMATMPSPQQVANGLIVRASELVGHG